MEDSIKKGRVSHTVIYQITFECEDVGGDIACCNVLEDG